MNFVTAVEAAALRGDVTAQTVRRWCRDGWIKSARQSGKVWLLDRQEALDFVPPTVGWPAGRPRKEKE